MHPLKILKMLNKKFISENKFNYNVNRNLHYNIYYDRHY